MGRDRNDLLQTICTDSYSDETIRKRKDWPGAPRALSGRLRRIAPELRSIGVDVEFGNRGDKRSTRTIAITKNPAQPSAPSVSSATRATVSITPNPADGRADAESAADDTMPSADHTASALPSVKHRDNGTGNDVTDANTRADGSAGPISPRHDTDMDIDLDGTEWGVVA